MSRSSWPLAELVLLVIATVVPWLLEAAGQDYYIGFATRLLIYALAATSLNFVVGYGGMVAFGHAAFFGGGAYGIALLMGEGIMSGWITWPLVIGAAMLMAGIIGAISLRTRGVYFIMITLAFAQMIYYSIISLQIAGGDDGLPLLQRSTLTPLDLTSDAGLYRVSLVVLAIVLYLLKRMAASRYGRALAGVRQNELRMEALGYPVLKLKWVCFVLAAGLAALAGALLANQTGMASPGQLYWTQSGTLLVMVILGGVGHRYGGVIGAIVLLGLEETLSQYSDHSHLYIGLLLLVVVLAAPRGLAPLIVKSR